MSREKWSHITDPVNALGARILDALDLLGAWHRPVRLRSLSRKLNANLLPLWDDALARLAEDKCITMEAGPRRQQLIRIIEVPDELRPKLIVRQSKRKRKRGQTQWFKRHLAGFRRRDGRDDGLQEQTSNPDEASGYEHNMS